MIYFFGTYGLAFRDDGRDPYTDTCSSCQHLTTMRPMKMMRFFHIMWIPLIPVSLLNPILRCSHCGADFKVKQ
jgi:hypothetical protein